MILLSCSFKHYKTFSYLSFIKYCLKFCFQKLWSLMQFLGGSLLHDISFIWFLLLGPNFLDNHQIWPTCLISLSCIFLEASSWIFLLIWVFPQESFKKLDLCVANFLTPRVPDNTFSMPSYLNDNLAGYKLLGSKFLH